MQFRRRPADGSRLPSRTSPCNMSDVEAMDRSVEISLQAVPLDDPRARELERRLITETKSRYGERGQSPLEPRAFDPPLGCFLLAFMGQEIVACGGFRALSEEVAEIKRMYVDPGSRGRGIGHAILAGLEHRAYASGYRAAWLETGSKQPEAIALYTAVGYTPIEAYGEFKLDPRSRCFFRTLAC